METYMPFNLTIKDLTDEELNALLDLLTEHLPKADFSLGVNKARQ